MCRLCTQEVRYILRNNDSPLNSRNELINNRRKYLLDNWKKKSKNIKQLLKTLRNNYWLQLIKPCNCSATRKRSFSSGIIVTLIDVL